MIDPILETSGPFLNECWTCGGAHDHETWLVVRFECACDLDKPYEWNLEHGKERREFARTLCQIGDCNLPANHAGSHRGSCGCINGCKAKDCPNL